MDTCCFRRFGQRPKRRATRAQFRQQVIDLPGQQRARGRKERPLVRVGSERIVQKYTVALPPGPALERQSNQVAEPTRGQRVLIGKHAVVGSERNAAAGIHGGAQQCVAELARLGAGDGFGKKQPDMGALAGAGTFQRERDTVRTANARNSAGTVLPVGVIEVQRQQIAGLVRQHGVQTDNIPPLCISPGQVTVDGCVIQWAQHAVRAFGAGHTPFLTQAGLPFVGADRAVAAFLRLFAMPAQGVDIGAAAEQGAKQANFLGGGTGAGDRGGVSLAERCAWGVAC